MQEARELAAAPRSEIDAVALWSLTIKVSSAEEAGEAALNRLRASTSRRLRLRGRFMANVERASVAVAELRDAMALESRRGRLVTIPDLDRTTPAGWAAAFGSAAIVAGVAVVVLTGGIAPGEAEREAVLDAAFPGQAPSHSHAPTASQSQAGSGPGAGGEPATAVHFDDVRMASGLGPGWSVEPPDATIGVAAMPNAVDRSARLEAAPSPAQACRDLDEALTPTDVSYDVLVEAGIAAARLTLSGGENDLTVELGGEGGQVSSRAGPLADIGAIEADRWYRVTVDTDRAQVRVSDRQSGEPGQATRLSASLAHPPYERVCLSTDGESGSASYFDNLTIHIEGG